MFAPWRLAFIQGEAGSDVPTPTGCIFCDFPLPPGAEVPRSVTCRDGAVVDVTAKDRREWDRERLVVTARRHAFVILNKFPYNNGHVMIVPRAHVQRLEDVDGEAFSELHALLQETLAAVRATYQPHGMNVGMNMGRAAGAGIEEHIHWHVVPRWNGDTNFMPALADTKVISEGLEDTWRRLAALLRRPEDDA